MASSSSASRELQQALDEPLRVSLNIVNSGKQHDVPALFRMMDGNAYTVTFGFYDVKAELVVDDSEKLTGSFTSKRDHGTYEATLSTIRANGSRCYKGSWNNKRKREGFEVEIPELRPLGLGESKRTRTLQSWDHSQAALRSWTLLNLGTDREPVFLIPDSQLFNDGGRSIMEFFVAAMRAKKIDLPYVSGTKEWKSWRPHPEGCGDRIRVNRLKTTADDILATHLRRNFAHVWHVSTPDRGYDAKDINVYYQGGSKGKHQDAQPYGSLVFVFCAGLTCTSSVWLEDGRRVDLTMKSGDCMVFEGKTHHRVNQCTPNTSPFGGDEWLGNRRLSILVRQKPPSSRMNVPKRHF